MRQPNNGTLGYGPFSLRALCFPRLPIRVADSSDTESLPARGSWESGVLELRLNPSSPSEWQQARGPKGAYPLFPHGRESRPPLFEGGSHEILR